MTPRGEARVQQILHNERVRQHFAPVGTEYYQAFTAGVRAAIEYVEMEETLPRPHVSTGDGA